MGTSLKEMVEAARKVIREIPAETAAEALNRGDGSFLVDVREPEEFAKGHIRGAVNIPRGMLELKADPASPLADPDLVANRDATVLVYCLRAPSARSVLAAETLGRMGYAKVAALEGGLLKWKDEGLPVEMPDPQ
jgi:rhodanese-related sulfurtransferase